MAGVRPSGGIVEAQSGGVVSPHGEGGVEVGGMGTWPRASAEASYCRVHCILSILCSK